MQVSDPGYLPISHVEMTDKEEFLLQNPVTPPVVHCQNRMIPTLWYREDNGLIVGQPKARESSAYNDRWNGELDKSTLENQRVILGEYLEKESSPDLSCSEDE